VYTVAITPNLSGGIEYPTHVMQGPNTIGRTTTHELGHQWFYGLVGDDQARDPWLDEGLASYAEARGENSLASFAQMAIPADARGKAGKPMTYWETHQASYYRGVYVQGANALASLGAVERVDCALRLYVARNAYRIARPADLVAAATTVFADAPTKLARFGITSNP
jgi:aminopeptidase N